MAFQFEANAPLQTEFRRIAREQLQKANAEIDNPQLSRAEAVHRVRKHCKKLRSLLRLVRPAFGGNYQSENKNLRDCARRVAGLRDAIVMLETCDKLLATCEQPVGRRQLATLRPNLVRLKARSKQSQSTGSATLRRLRDDLCATLQRVSHWTLKSDAFDAIENGFFKTYARARKAMQHAMKHPNAERYHEWRKRVKYHRYQVRLLRQLWPELMDALGKEVKRLSDLLGEDHDLAVLQQEFLASPEAFGSRYERQPAHEALEQRSQALRKKARLLGHRIYAENHPLIRRFYGCWKLAKLPTENR